MPTSDHDPTATLRPTTPEGYGEPVRFDYPLWLLVVLVLLLTPPAVLVGGWLLYHAQGPDLLALFAFEETETGFSFTVVSGSIAVAFLVAVAGVTVAHELVHGLVYRLRGYEVSYGVAPHVGAFYVAAFHQFQGRRDNLLVGIAPLVVLTPLLAGLVFVPSPLVAFGAFVALVVNTAGSAGDLYLVARLLRLPDGTLMYDSDVRSSFVYRPAESGDGETVGVESQT
ncbi:DUF3267 domain-containing protein [Haloarchaeobius amylolyticus]|uniref:DUF3267 domain-containing protein n=1 Tax=Haloarchaeobius amylolyticus TaxID=1198296 RepID=UPI00226F4D24|nr:DUF3267 domain-containing protein [Haloarchaeobius amylolyticus]